MADNDNRHNDDGTGWCTGCGCAYPCPGSAEAAQTVGEALRPKSTRRTEE